MNKNALLSILMAVSFFVASPLFSADKSTEELMGDLDTNQPLLQMSACKKLGEKKEKEAIGILIDLLGNSSDQRVASSAAAALGAIGEKGKSAEALYKSAQNDQATSVQYTSLLALANINDSDYKEKTLELLTSLESGSKDDLVKDLASNLKIRMEK